MPDLVIIGAGGLGRETLAAVRAVPDGPQALRPLAFLDDNPAVAGRTVDGLPVAGGSDLLAAYPDALVAVCVGSPGANRTRQTVVERLALPAERFARIVHPSAQLARGTEIGPGAVVLALVVTTTPVSLGSHTTFMPGCVLTHDDVVADYAVLAAGVHLGGGVSVGSGAYLGMGALVREKVSIGAGTTIGMGSVVLADVPAGQVWVGSPARRLR